MSYRIVALLDRPSSDSLAVVPFVAVDEQSGTLQVCGLVNGPERLRDDDLIDLLRRGDALEVGSEIRLPSGVQIRNWAAGWYGAAFRERLMQIGGPAVPLPAGVERLAEGGVFWADEAGRVYQVLERWVTDAMRQCLIRQDRRLAELMEMALPERIETRTALYLTRATDEERRKELRWWARVDKQAGRPVTEEQLLARILETEASLYQRV